MPDDTSVRRRRDGETMCGLGKWHPQWMQPYATTKMFMSVYGLLGTIQGMSYLYFIVTLTTIEKRFKMPSQTTGIVLSGNEISQILLSLVLSYIGGQRNRPRWIAWGVVFCGLSCFILALPHFIYGAGEDALRLTKEYAESKYKDLLENGTSIHSLVKSSVQTSHELCDAVRTDDECDSLVSIVPLVLIFLSQFVLGIGNTLYYALGQTYLDDNTKKTNTPLIMAIAMSLRMIGPIVGFFLGFISLNTFIDPRKTPLIDSDDPRWMGAWWLGWMVLGSLMVLFAGLIGLFPKQLPKKSKRTHYNSHMPQVLRQEELQLEDEGLPLGRGFASNPALDAPQQGTSELPTLKNFPKALKRLLRNKLLMFNITAAIFFILGASAFMTFLSKYMEVQFHKSAQSGTIVVGPLSITGMIIGLVGSGIFLSKKKPSAHKVLLWNVIVGCIAVMGPFIYLFLYCGDSNTMLTDGKLNLTAPCNANCDCDGLPYSPICHEPTETTFFSPCHAGCHHWDVKEKVFANCSCLPIDSVSSTESPPTTIASDPASLAAKIKTSLPKLLQPLLATTTTLATTGSTTGLLMPSSSPFEADPAYTTPSTDSSIYFTDSSTEGLLARSKRSVMELTNSVRPGVCLQGCGMAFWGFSLTSMVVNWFSSSGRIGNLLVNYRSVATEDKSFAQGLLLMLISLFALIPGPIIFGAVIDSTCLVWTETCSGKGNCQLYDQDAFRYRVNILACILTTMGVFFDFLVWYNGRDLDLYGEKEQQRLDELRHKNQPITPLLAKKDLRNRDE